MRAAFRTLRVKSCHMLAFMCQKSSHLAGDGGQSVWFLRTWGHIFSFQVCDKPVQNLSTGQKE